MNSRSLPGGCTALLALLALCSCASSRDPGNTIRIGLFADLSSASAREGNDVLKGVKVRLDETNATGGIGGREVRLIEMDVKQDPAEAVKAYTTLALEDRVSAVIGSPAASTALAVSPVAERLGVPVLSLSMDDRVALPEADPGGGAGSGSARRFTFLGRPSALQLAFSIASFAAGNFNIRRYATLWDPQSTLSVLQARGFEAAITRAGLLIVSSQGLGEQGVARSLVALTDAHAEAVFVCLSAEQNAAVALQAREQGFIPLLLGNEAWLSPPVQRAGTAADGAWFAAGLAPDDPVIDRLSAGFVARWGEAPRPASVAGWDAAGLVVQAIQNADSPQPAAIRDALERTHAFSWHNGAVSFDPGTHRLRGASVAIMRIFGGAFVAAQRRYVSPLPP